MNTPARSWYYAQAGTSYGPIDVVELRALIANGQLGPHDPVRHEGWPNWFTIADAAETIGVQPGATGAGGSHLADQQPVVGSVAAYDAQHDQYAAYGNQAQGRPNEDAFHAAPSSDMHRAAPEGHNPLSAPVPQQAQAPQHAQAPLPLYTPQADKGQPHFHDPQPAFQHQQHEGAGQQPDDPPVGVGLGWRLASWSIDLAVLVAVLILTNAAAGGFPPAGSFLMVAFFAAYIVVFPGFGVGPLGHMLLGLRVVDAETGQPATRAAMIARGLIMLLLALPMMVGILASIAVAVSSPGTRAIHDAATNTVVRRK